MAKTREITRNKAKTAAATTTTTPLNNINGKVHKVRVNVKNMKTSIKSKDEATKINSINIEDQLSTSKTSLCFVKLRRTRINDVGCNNNNNNSNNTLQAQCKVNEQIVEVSKNIRKNTRGRKKGSKNNLSEKSNDNVNQTKAYVKNISTRIRSRPMNTNELENSISDVGGNAKANDNDVVPLTPKATRRCVIKLQKTPRSLKAKDIVIDPSDNAYNKAKDIEVVPSTPSCGRKCVVKLQRTPGLTKPKAVIETLTPSTNRNCVVRMKRTRLAHKNNKNGDSPSSTNPSQLPVIDQNKRDNFRKLSLTKSLRKSTENDKTNTTNNSKTEQQQTTEYLNNNNNPTELKQQTIETLNNNNNIKPTNNLVKAQNGMKLLSKLSLRKSTRPILKNVVNNLEITQFEPQQNSTICFEPARNSTLLEFGFTKDKNKENINPKETINITNIKEKSAAKDKSTAKEKSSSKDKSSFKDDNSSVKDKSDKSSSINKSLSQNLANKSVEIENILNSLDEDDVLLLKSPERNNNNENEKEKTAENIISPNKNKTHKFFNRSKENQQNTSPKHTNKPQIISPAKPKEVPKKRRFLTKRSTLAKPDNIYEFLSQSQTSDSDNNTKQADPTADIIKKLIEQGKVRVATNCKGKGKPIFKRRAPPPKQMKKIKQAADKKLKQLKKNQLKTKIAKSNENKINNNDNNTGNDDNNDEVIVEHFDDHFDNEDVLPDVDYNLESPRNNGLTKRPSHSNSKNDIQEGTLSRLARTVLINQASRSDAQRKNASLLLEKVKQFISTPKNKKMPSAQIGLESDLSPIAMPQSRPPTIASPWRVNDDAYLPKTFNFYRSSGNLPSFSSDFIPATPRKEKPKNNVNISQLQAPTNSEKSPIIGNQNSKAGTSNMQSPLHTNIEENISTPPRGVNNDNEPSVISSFSSNDSNAENMPPPRPLGENSTNENDNIFNMKQLPNPRRALSYRSPLKNINILEVVHLPPLKNLNETPNTNDKQKTGDVIDMFGFEENLAEDSILTEESIVSNNPPQTAETNKNTKNRTKEDLFGFEDFLSQTEYSSQENAETTNQTNTNVQNLTIHDKLQDLRKLKPADNELEINLLKEKSKRPLRPLPLFDDEAAVDLDGKRQRGIKEMLCSTLINPQPSTSKEALRELRKRNLQNSNRPQFGEDLEISELFKDPEPETTFNENDAHRTYIRPHKRKRRLKENKFVMFLDSDASDDEDLSNEHRKHQHSHETDTSSEQQAPKKKRQRKEPKEKPELKEFVDEFNEMCKEVESFELIVEKSA